MSGKVVWIAFWMTMTYWIGGFWGCAAPGDDQNYKILEEDEVQFQTEPSNLQSRQDIAQQLGLTLVVADETASEKVTTADEVPTTADHPEPGASEHPTAEPSEEVPAPTNRPIAPELRPSLAGLDRSHWAQMIIGPSSGTTYHHPIYFTDIDLIKTPSEVQADDRIDDEAHDAALVRSVDGAKTGNLAHSANALGLIVQPAKFGLDLLFWPVNAVRHPPLSSASSGRRTGGTDFDIRKGG